jgi:hypothetical protein
MIDREGEGGGGHCDVQLNGNICRRFVAGNVTADLERSQVRTTAKLNEMGLEGLGID